MDFFKENITATETDMKKLLVIMAVILLSGCASTLSERVANTQKEIDLAITALGYTKSDILLSQFEETTKRTLTDGEIYHVHGLEESI